MQFNHYDSEGFFDEMIAEGGGPRAAVGALSRAIEALASGELVSRQAGAERALMQMGITFNVYGEQAGLEKIFPFDIVPRIVSATEWSSPGTGPQATHSRAEPVHR